MAERCLREVAGIDTTADNESIVLAGDSPNISAFSGIRSGSLTYDVLSCRINLAGSRKAKAPMDLPTGERSCGGPAVGCSVAMA